MAPMVAMATVQVAIYGHGSILADVRRVTNEVGRELKVVLPEARPA